jgi:hypothetical protein
MLRHIPLAPMLALAMALAAAAPATAGGLSAPIVEPGRIAGACAPSPLARPVASIPAVPRGYARAFEDGRLNPRRGPRTVCGDQQMARLWDTARVPMRGH